MYNTSTRKFEQFKLTGSFYLIMTNERSQVMITGAIPLSEIVDF